MPSDSERTSGLDLAADLVLPWIGPLLSRIGLSPRAWLQLTVSLYVSVVTSAWAERYVLSLLFFVAALVTGRFLVWRSKVREGAEGIDGETPPQQLVDWYANMNSFILTFVMSWLLFEKIRFVTGPHAAYAFSSLLMLAGTGIGRIHPLLENVVLNRNVIFASALAALVYLDPPGPGVVHVDLGF